MQKLLSQYTQLTLWFTILLAIAAPAYVAYDLFLRQPEELASLHHEYIERGSYLFAANQCWFCHGFKGEGGIGLPLNITADLVKRDDKDPFIYKTIARGRRGTQMGSWHKEEGGLLDTEDIKALRAFIRDGTHWGEYFDIHPVVVENGQVVKGKPGVKAWKKTENFLVEHGLATPTPVAATPEERGKAYLDAKTGPCGACHNITTETRQPIGAPGLAGIFQKDKLPNGQPVNDDNMKEWIRKGSTSYKPAGTQPFMPPYEAVLNTDDKMADLLAFLKTLTK